MDNQNLTGLVKTKMFNALPEKIGLYNPQYEHDSCGIGFIAHVRGEKSHDLVVSALKMISNMAHRGGCGSDGKSGDGAGIMIQKPHEFYKRACAGEGIDIPDESEYGTGFFFMPSDDMLRLSFENLIEKIIVEEGQSLIGWRTPATNPAALGDSAIKTMPHIRQLFVGKGLGMTAEAFERILYVIRRRIEKEISKRNDGEEQFYITGLSSKTVVYKGMLAAGQVADFYRDLSDPRLASAIALVHSRYSTNTFPSWSRAHPNRYIAHNGEFNTIRGNVNAMKMRQPAMRSELFEEYYEKLLPIIEENGSDSSMFDNCLEFLHLSGRSLPEAVMMMIPEPWSAHESMSDDKKAFYEFHSCLMEPWDGPAAVVFTDGDSVGAVLDRNGLRPARYCVTSDDFVILASETGVLDIPAERIIKKDRLRPGRMLLVDTVRGKIVDDDDIKNIAARKKPYRSWLNKGMLKLDQIKADDIGHFYDPQTLLKLQTAFGYTYEDLRLILKPMAENSEEATGAMGVDYSLAVLSDKPQLLYSYFKQMFAQVTNPPIDALREELVVDTGILIGKRGNVLDPDYLCCNLIKLENPILDNIELLKFANIDLQSHRAEKLSVLFKAEDGVSGLENAVQRIFALADEAIEKGNDILILSDRGVDSENVPVPMLLAVSGLHHHLLRNGRRSKVSLIAETGEAREIHHFCLLLSFGASAVNPYIAFESLKEMTENGLMESTTYHCAVKNYKKAALKGIVKVLSKMGISTIQSYQGAQLFEAIGISTDVITRYFTHTPSRIEGIGIEDIAIDALKRHEKAYCGNTALNCLEGGGKNQWRKDGEYHLYNPETIAKLQAACRENDYAVFKEFADSIDKQSQTMCTLRGLLDFNMSNPPIPLEEVEPVESIMKRFKTGAMSYGSLSREAHEALAIAMNRIGGKSNTGEGGEDPERFINMPSADSRRSSIKQVASGRFGVTSEYLVNADEIQIKMAQGAKPGEGGQLPGSKVYPWIARTRYSTPGVELISPPPHHDIYSIEDLAQLIYDLKCANRKARISVKLVAEAGVGTVAAGVAKAGADVILISGHDGGTGAAPRTSIHHAGIPWELGLAETHQTLCLNNLREKVVLETDGKLMTGRDVAIAALLGAQEFGFATAPLVALGCVMMRVCNLDTCPVGIATQHPGLRGKFTGKPDYVVNFMRFVAMNLREWMAALGLKTVGEMTGRADRLKIEADIENRKAGKIDLTKLLYNAAYMNEDRSYCITRDYLNDSLDVRKLLDTAKPALSNGAKVKATFAIQNTDRAAGTILGSELTRLFGSKGLSDDSIRFKFTGSAGQSFGAFIPKGITLEIEGDANDYPGKGLSGGKIIVYPPKSAAFEPEKNVIAGNAAFYGATSGEGYIRGIAGERFCVRNSGVNVVVEGVGDHGCEYMTGGNVVVLGETGRNFAAGMSGGTAYVFDPDEDFLSKCNKGMVELEFLDDRDESAKVMKMVRKHFEYTGSLLAGRILLDWNENKMKFVKVIPRDYKDMKKAIKDALKDGMSEEQAEFLAFETHIAGKAKEA
jgi:glutamate synthase (ferredoxin)